MLKLVLVLAVLFLFGFGASATTVNFDDYNTGGPTSFASADRYRSDGIVFSRTIPISNIALVEPSFYPTFIARGGSVSNALSLTMQDVGFLSIDAHFVLPGTSTQGVTDYLQIRMFDTGIGSIMGGLEVYNLSEALLVSTNLTTPASMSGLLTLNLPGMARFRLWTDSDGAFFDNLTFATPVPEPSSGILLVFGVSLLGCAVQFIRRRNSRNTSA